MDKSPVHPGRIGTESAHSSPRRQLASQRLRICPNHRAMAIQMDPPRGPLPAVAQVLAEAALQRQNMLLGADNERSAPVAAPQPPVLPAPGAPAAPLAPPSLPEGASDAAHADRVSLSRQASQALQAQGQGLQRLPGSPALPGSSGPAPALSAPGTPGQAPGALQGAMPWPASGVSPALRGLLGALVQQLTPFAPQRVVEAQPWGAAMPGAGGGAAAESELPPLQTWWVGQGHVHTGQGVRGFTATLRVPAAWLLSVSQAPAPHAAHALQVAFAGQPQALVGGLFALVLQPGAAAGDPTAAARAAGSTSALLSLELAPMAGAAANVVYGRDQLQARNDPWLHMLALQASGYGREEEEAAERRRKRGLCDAPGCPYAGRAPCEQPFCLAMRALPVQAVPPVGEV